MRPAAAALPLLLLHLLSLCFIPSFNVIFPATAATGENPLTPKAHVIRYWKTQISNDLPKPEFLLKKASPLTVAQYAAFSKLAADQNSLAEKLPVFCAAAKLLCFPDLSQSLDKHNDDVNFNNYNNDNFTTYGTRRVGGADAFKAYSEDGNVVLGSFRRYSRGSTGHNDGFNSYATNANVVDQTFNTYGNSATGGEGQFSNFSGQANEPNLRFQSYSDSANGRTQKFTGYSDSANSGDEGFASYGKNGNAAVNSFAGYGKDSNVLGSTFTNYGENGNAPNDTFTSYGTNTNVPENTFKTYGNQANGATDTFTSYRDQANVGDDTFQSYAAKSSAADVEFQNYGQSYNEGSDKFKTYGGGGATDTKAGFKVYSTNNTFTDYNNVSTTFASYKNATPSAAGDKKVNSKWSVEPGKFFKEAMLKNGSIMDMPDIRDKMPERSFLPRAIVSKLPFSTSKFTEMKKIFRAGEDESSMSKMMNDALADCERAPSPGETKRCVASIEDMIDFATSVLGRDVVVRSINTTRGYNSKVMLGNVKGINGGKVTKSVSCHQSLYPYLLYYCHSVPKVRVYEADILDPNTKDKINHGAAICHLDTTSWSANHGAFIALNSSPGKTEVCHWIFEGDMTWATAD